MDGVVSQDEPTATDVQQVEASAADAPVEPTATEVLFVTADKKNMRVPKDIALMMGSIRSIMEDLEPEDLADGIALHNDATEQVMAKSDSEITPEELKEWRKTPLDGDDKMYEIRDDVDDETKRVDIMKARMNEFYTLTRTVNYLDIPLMLHTLMKALNQFIMGKTPAEISDKLGIPIESFTEAEVAAVKQAHLWLGDIRLPRKPLPKQG